MYKDNGDLILINGNVVSVANNSIGKSTAIVIKGNRIIYVGDDDTARELAGRETEIIDLNKKVLLPGFIESHMHPFTLANNKLGVECGGDNTKSLESVLKALEERVKTTEKGQWIRGFGWDESKFPHAKNPTRYDLDKVSPDNPVILTRTCVHVAVCNSKALELGKINKNTPNPEGGHIDKDPKTGEPTGLLQERAMEILPVTPYTTQQLKQGMKMVFEELGRNGITSACDMSAQRESIHVYQQLLKEGSLTARIRMWPVAQTMILGDGMIEEMLTLGLESGFGNDMLNIQGMKYVLDGSVSGKTAAVYEHYLDDPEAKGIIYCDDETEMIENIRRGFQNGLRASVHAIGDRAIDYALNIYKKAGEGIDTSKMRNRMEHVILPTKKQLREIKDMGIVVGSSYGFLYHLGEGYLNALGAERVKKAVPQKSFQDLGIIAPGNTDCPVCDMNPLLAIYGITNRKTFKGSSLGDKERIDVMEALRTYTEYAAYSMFDEKITGSVEVGKYADLVVLDKNIIDVNIEEIKDIKVDMTIMNGEVIYKK